MKNLPLVSLLVLSQSAFSQFYYNDIISPANISNKMSDNILNNVATINAPVTEAYVMIIY